MDNELNGAAVEASPPNHLTHDELPNEDVPEAAQPPPLEGAADPVATLPIEEVDRWFAQGDAMRAAALAHREYLLEQLARIDERLARLGVMAVSEIAISPLEGVDLDSVMGKQPRATKAKGKRGRKAKRAAPVARKAAGADGAPPDKVLNALTNRPAALDVIAKKLKLDRLQVRQSLLVLHAEGKVKRSGIGGALYSRAA